MNCIKATKIPKRTLCGTLCMNFVAGVSVEVNVVDNVCADSFIEGLYKALALE